MKVVVPPAPLPELPRKIKPSRLTGSLVEAFDNGFVARIMASIAGFGALIMLWLLSATGSALVAGSFGAGAGLAVVLLKSQQLFVLRVLRPKAEGEINLWGRFPLAVVLTFKYLLLFVVMGIMFELRLLQPVALAGGFIFGQVVIVGKVVGRMVALRMRARQLKIETHVA